LTIVTEFIGITLAVGYLGLPTVPSVVLAAVLVVGAASTGSFRRFERLCLVLVAGSLLLIPIYLLAHPPVTEMARSFVTPVFPAGEQLSTVMLLIIGIVGTTTVPAGVRAPVARARVLKAVRSSAAVSTWAGSVIVCALAQHRSWVPTSTPTTPDGDPGQSGVHVDETADHRGVPRVVVAGDPHVVVPGG